MQHSTADIDFEAALLTDRAWLVRLCARLSGRAEAAEDLAQETLLEAWRNRHKLRCGSESRAWLAAIARFVCLRWRRRKWREQVQGGSLPDENLLPAYENEMTATDPFDVETALNRAELAELLDRAMVLLPAETRALLVQQYVEEMPRAEIAARLGVGEGAVAVRLHRGRLALRRILTTDLKAEAAALGLVDGESDTLQETRLWCPRCGKHHLVGRFTSGNEGEFLLRCTECDPEPELPFVKAPVSDAVATPLGGIKGYKPALSRLASFWHNYYRQGLEHGAVPCLRCGKPTPLSRNGGEKIASDSYLTNGLFARCAHCRTTCFADMNGLVLCSPEAQRFWRTNPRLHTLPELHLQLHGRPAVVTRFASMTGAAELEVVSARDTYQILECHTAPSIPSSATPSSALTSSALK
jgi:RNA polymerase sigma-70 factor (ECF subfamily)